MDSRLANALGLGGETQHDPAIGSNPLSDEGRTAYREGEIDDDLRERLVEALQGRVKKRCLLVQGERGTEMTRTAYEALRAAGGELARQGKTNVKVLVPKSPPDSSALSKLFALDPFPFDTSVVLWLDQLDAYLRPGATLTVDDLGQLARVDPPTCVLATIERRSKDAIRHPEGIAVLDAFGPNTVFIDDPPTTA